MPSTTTNVTLHLPTGTVAELIELIDRENSATKNRLVSAVLSTGDYNAHAVPLAEQSKHLLAMRASLQHFLNEHQATA